MDATHSISSTNIRRVGDLAPVVVSRVHARTHIHTYASQSRKGTVNARAVSGERDCHLPLNEPSENTSATTRVQQNTQRERETRRILCSSFNIRSLHMYVHYEKAPKCQMYQPVGGCCCRNTFANGLPFEV